MSELIEIVEDPEASPRVKRRAMAILGADRGESFKATAERLGMCRNRVARLQRRYSSEGLACIEDRSRPGRPPTEPKISLSAGDRERLERAAAGNDPHVSAVKARMVLLTERLEGVTAIARELGVRHGHVSKWLQRYIVEGYAGLKDREPARPKRKIRQAEVMRFAAQAVGAFYPQRQVPQAEEYGARGISRGSWHRLKKALIRWSDFNDSVLAPVRPKTLVDLKALVMTPGIRVAVFAHDDLATNEHADRLSRTTWQHLTSSGCQEIIDYRAEHPDLSPHGGHSHKVSLVLEAMGEGDAEVEHLNTVARLITSSTGPLTVACGSFNAACVAMAIKWLTKRDDLRIRVTDFATAAGSIVNAFAIFHPEAFQRNLLPALDALSPIAPGEGLAWFAQGGDISAAGERPGEGPGEGQA